MKRKILSWTLIVLSALSLFLSAAGEIAAWALNEPLTRLVLTQLNGIDSELRQGETALAKSHAELEGALSALDSTEQALNQFTQNDPKAFFEDVQTTLDDELVPELKTARERLISARDTLENVRVVVFGLNVVPFININIPDKTLADLIDSADALESKIGDVSALAEQASVFLADASELFSGDFGESRENLEGFLADVEEYQAKVEGWRGQVADLKDSLPGSIDLATLFLTVILLWFGLSQFSLLLHGLTLLRGHNPLDALRA